MTLKLLQHASIGSEKTLSTSKHILFVFSDKLEKDFPFAKN